MGVETFYVLPDTNFLRLGGHTISQVRFMQ